MLHEMNPQVAITVEYFPPPRQINEAGAQVGISAHAVLHISKYTRQNAAQS